MKVNILLSALVQLTTATLFFICERSFRHAVLDGWPATDLSRGRSPVGSGPFLIRILSEGPASGPCPFFRSARTLTSCISQKLLAICPGSCYTFRCGQEIWPGAHGALAQLVVRYIRIVEVRGSTPLCSTQSSEDSELFSSKQRVADSDSESESATQERKSHAVY